MEQPGEGEFKIMQKIREMHLSENDLVMIVSPDADMIQQMLLAAERCTL